MLVKDRWGCDSCPRNKFVPAVGLYTDVFGFVYGLCVDHYPAMKVWVEGASKDTRVGMPRGAVQLLPEAHTGEAGEWPRP